jgi:hypothetical protein
MFTIHLFLVIFCKRNLALYNESQIKWGILMEKEKEIKNELETDKVQAIYQKKHVH